MPTFLSDPPSNFYIFLAVITIITGAIWLNGRSRKALLAFLVSLAILLLLFLIDKFVESPREQAVRKIQELAQATQGSDAAAISKHFSEQFRYGTTTKKQVSEKLQQMKRSWPDWTGGDVWSFDRAEYEMPNEKTLKIGFSGQARGFPQTIHFLKATFQLEADGEWRITGLAFYDPLQKDKGPEQKIPEFGQ